MECYEVSGPQDVLEELSCLASVSHLNSHFTLRTMPKKTALPVPRSHWR